MSKNAIIALVAGIAALALASIWIFSDGKADEQPERPRIHASDFR